MKTGYIYSLFLHVTALILFIIAIPSFNHSIIEETIITIETLPISSQTNIQQLKNDLSPTQDNKKSQDNKVIKKAITQKNLTEKPKVDKDIISKEKPKESKESILPKENSIKSSEKNTKPKEEFKKPDKVATNHTSQDPSSQTEKSQALSQDFDSLLKNLEAETSNNQNISDAEKGANKEKYNEILPLSLSEKDAIKSQIIGCWSIPAGGKDAKDMYVAVTADVEKDGTIKNIEIQKRSNYTLANKAFYDVFVESAVRALQKCSPLQGLPIEKYESWQKLEMLFDPKELIY